MLFSCLEAESEVRWKSLYFSPYFLVAITCAVVTMRLYFLFLVDRSRTEIVDREVFDPCPLDGAGE